jgi:flagellar motor switch protein FliG
VAARDIAEARRAIVDSVLRLSAEGTIEVPSQDAA